MNPYTGRSHLSTEPKGGEYTVDRMIPFGEEVDLTGGGLGLVLTTDEFPRD